MTNYMSFYGNIHNAIDEDPRINSNMEKVPNPLFEHSVLGSLEHQIFEKKNDLFILIQEKQDILALLEILNVWKHF